MRFVQIGILVCLTAITGLLFAIYQQQQPPVEPAGQEMVRLEPPVAAASNLAEPEQRPTSVRSRAMMIPARATAAVLPPRVIEPLPETPTLAAAASGQGPKVEPPALIEPPEPALPEPVLAMMEVAEQVPEVAAPEPRTATIVSGTELEIRLESTLSTLRNQSGDEFRATLVEPLIAEGLIVADSGSIVEGRVAEVVRAGRIEGRAAMTVELTRLRTDDGQWIDLTTSTFREEAQPTQNRDLKRIGIGAAVGAAVGGILGGGKGAAIGAGVGGGAGAGTAAATRGDPVVMRPETRIDFRLQRDVTVTEQL